MSERLQKRKYTFTVEGETEQWYLLWLKDRINECPERKFDVILDPKVQQSPAKFSKRITNVTTPVIFHICDVESNEQMHVDKFQGILSEMKEVKTNKKINYHLGYSNFTFELWMILHKKDCFGTLAHRDHYLTHINKAFKENFEDLSHYKQKKNFERCLSKLTLSDVKNAIQRADHIMSDNVRNNRTLKRYKGYKYYPDNPSLSIHTIIKEILSDCGLL